MAHHNLDTFAMRFLEYRGKVRPPLYAVIKMLEKLQVHNNVELISRREESLTGMISAYNQLRQRKECAGLADGTDLEDPLSTKEVSEWIQSLIPKIRSALRDFKNSEAGWGNVQFHKKIENGALAVEDPKGHIELLGRLFWELDEFCDVIVGPVTGGVELVPEE